jgi:trimeric autotransporter adhesin
MAALAFAVSAAFAVPATAQIVKQEGTDLLSGLVKVGERLSPPPSVEPLADLRSSLAPAVRDGWSRFEAQVDGEWHGFVDKRNGHLEYAEGAGVPWVPGRGNRLTAADVAAHTGGKSRLDLAALESVARGFLPKVAPLLGVDPAELVLDRGRSGQMADHLWFVDFNVVRGGLTVEGARVVFRVSHGNLIQFGTESLPAPGTRVPAVTVGREAALAALGGYIGGFHTTDAIVDPGSLHLLPATAPDARFTDGFELGKGYALIAVWQFQFRREGVLGTWRARVDASTGEVLELYDANEYAKATGGVYPDSFIFGNETVLPMPFTNLSTGGFANSAGFFTFGGGALSSTLNGEFVRVVDTCGGISLNANGSGDLLFGTSGGTDCTTPGTGGAGNTHAARMQYYHVNRAKEVGRGWLPANTWLNGKLTVNTNLNQICNAYWNGSTLNFFRSGGGCGNTGETAGISLHEYGHGIDSNDGNGSSLENGTGETYGDFQAALATHSSCVGTGFLPGNCGGYGDACTACTGVRDIDWAKHVSNTPHTVANYTQVRCPQPAANNPNYVGACGRDAIARGVLSDKREGHCESYISSEGLWDFAARDLPSPGSGAAWSIVDRLWYLSRSTANTGFICNTAVSPWTSNGCATGTYWRAMRAVDDDDGNLANGTPHSCNLFAAFDRHGMACAADPGANVCFSGCTPPAVPTLTVTPGIAQNQVAWTSSGAGAVYDVYRNEAGCNAGFIKIANDVAGLALADTAVAPGLAYFYQVVAHPTGSEACGAAPTTCQTATPAACVPPAAPTGLTATAVGMNRIDLSWSASPGAVEYHVLRAIASGGPYTQVATVTAPTTTFSNTGLAGNTTYYYVVRAFAVCGSLNSNEASATSAGPPCTPQTLYFNNFDFATSFSNWSVGTFLGGGPTADWRGVQACTAQSGSNVFRFGGTGCTNNYTDNQFNFAQPNGAAGITVPAGTENTRLSFAHRRDFESGFDGGTIRLSLDGTNYTEVPASTVFSGPAYDDVVAPDCAPAGAAGLNIFSGNQSTFQTTVIDLDAACDLVSGGSGGCDGQTLRIAFTTVADCGANGDGWFLDDVRVNTCVTGAGPQPGFFTVSPCRLIDTRNAVGPSGGPALQPSAQRTFSLTNACGIPASAKAVSVNITVTEAAAFGNLRMYPADVAAPLVSSINFGPGQTRANNAIVTLAVDASGGIKLQNDSTGSVHFILDVNGYFE